MLTGVRSGKQIWEIKELFPPQSSTQAEAQLSFALILDGPEAVATPLEELKTETVWYKQQILDASRETKLWRKGWIRDPGWIREEYLPITGTDAQKSCWQMGSYTTDKHDSMFFRSYK